MSVGKRQLNFSFLWLFSQIQHPIICLSTDYKIIVANDNMLSLFNCPGNKALRRSFLKLLKRSELTSNLPAKLSLIECNNTFQIKSTKEPHTEWNNWEWRPHWLRSDDHPKRKEILVLLGQQIGHTKSQSEVFKTYSLKESFQLSQLFNDLITLFQPLANQKGVELHYCQADEAPCRVIGYRQRLYYVLWRLLNYILKYAKQGKICISCKKTDDLPEQIALEFIIQHIKTIPPSETSDQTKADPFGKELATVTELVKDMRGTLEIIASENKTFKLTLPFDKFSEKAIWDCHEANSPYHTDLSKILEPEPNYLKILVVEDEKLCQEHLKDILNDTLHCKIDIAGNAQDALNYLSQKAAGISHPYDFAIMDIGLPDKDGISLTREIRRRLKLSFPILAVTGYDWDINKLEEGLFNGLIKKPITPHKLQHAIHQSAIKIRSCKKDSDT